MQKATFHLALNVTDLKKAYDFYGQLLGATPGRSTDSWIDFDFFGHQLSLHLGTPLNSENMGKVDNIKVPMPHFGVILPLDIWQKMAEKLELANIEFIVPPTLRFKNLAAQQYTMFFVDPFGHPIELKSFVNMNEVFKP